MGEILYWCAGNFLELLATITGLIYLIYSVRGDSKLWFYGFITSLLYVYVFFKAAIYADMGINIYYVVISIYGWFHWNFKGNFQKTELPILHINTKKSLVLLAITAVIFLAIYFLLNKFTDSDIAIFDALTTSISITATWMLAKKYLEHWLVWVVVDFLSVGLYIYKQLYPTVVLFVVYTVLAVVGFYQWRKQYQIQITR